MWQNLIEAILGEGGAERPFLPGDGTEGIPYAV